MKFFIFIVTCVCLMMISPEAQAVCGKQCKQAKSYCKSWEKKNPGFECGTVRGAVCTGKSWKKIKQVNGAWSACKLVAGEKDHKSAKARCNEFEKNWGGKCQIHSPSCKAGWVKLAKYGKFRACRPIEVSANMRYNAYKAYMRRFEGKAGTKMHPAIIDFAKKNFSFDASKVKWGYASNTPGGCITDCDKIYCDNKSIIDFVKKPWGANDIDIVWHELQHVQQCKQKGSRKNYAKMWFGDLPAGFFGALDPKVKDKFKNKIHDKMPMEKNAESKAKSIHKKWQKGYWHEKKHCRIYAKDKKKVLKKSKDKTSRLNCDTKYSKKAKDYFNKHAKNLAKKNGYGKYYFAFGEPHKNKGVWTGEGTFGTKPKRMKTGK